MASRNRAADTHQRKPRCWRHSSHRGFTLLELMIAMAIMATALSVAWPLLRRPLMQNVSQEAAQQVIATLGEARATAITLGMPVQIRYQPGGQLYQLCPIDGPVATAASNAAAPGGPTMATATSPPGSQDYELPVDVKFAAPVRDQVAASLSVVDRLPPATTQDTDHTASRTADPITAPEIHWSTPIHFFPDGRAEQATLSIEGPDAVVIDITLRGLTGTATAGAPQRRPQPNNTASPTSLSLPAGP
jgi:prepilin-type N-terminal cleavage/methylation domain-containing protein